MNNKSQIQDGLESHANVVYNTKKLMLMVKICRQKRQQFIIMMTGQSWRKIYGIKM